jgi:hypothetical protein
MRLLLSIALAALLGGGGLAPHAEAAVAKKNKKERKPQDPSTVKLGRRCKTKADCGHRRQICLKQSDARGKLIGRGFCALPCRAVDQGMTPKDPPPPMTDAGTVKTKPIPPRCPQNFDCRSAGAGVPIDLCVHGVKQ